MTGRGKGGKGLGKGGAKRHRKVLRDYIQGITKPAIRRLARRGGVKRNSGLIYEETRGVPKVLWRTLFGTLLRTPNTLSVRPLRRWTWSMLWNDRDAHYTVLEVNRLVFLQRPFSGPQYHILGRICRFSVRIYKFLDATSLPRKIITSTNCSTWFQCARVSYIYTYVVIV